MHCFIKNIGLPLSEDAQIAALTHGRTRAVTLGIGHFHTAEGDKVSRFFVNLMSFGISGEINKSVNAKPNLKRYLPSLVFGLMAMQKLFSYRPQDIAILGDNGIGASGPMLLGAVCNGVWTGGTMMIAPKADCFNPQLDIIIAKQMPLISTLKAFLALFKGKHIHHKNVISQKALSADISKREDRDMMLDMDGDHVGYLPARAESRAAAINIYC